MTVAEVNEALDEIVATNEAEGKEAVMKILRDLFLKMDEMLQIVSEGMKLVPQIVGVKVALNLYVRLTDYALLLDFSNVA